MKEKLKSYIDKSRTAVKKVSKKIWILLAVVVAAAIVATVVLTGNKSYATLVTGVTSEEMTAILSWLDTQGYQDYRIEGNDNTIVVPTSQENQLRARMLMEGYPKSGFNYDTYFNHVGALSTQSERSTAFRIALEEKMASTIRCFDGVRDATVTINPGEDRGYVLDSNNVVEASATVFVTMQEGKQLTTQQANAIRSLVSRAVASLDVSAITLTDNWGNLYSSGAENLTNDLTALMIQLQEEWSNRIRTNVMQVLEPVYGQDNVKVAVHCDVDVSNSTIDDYQVHQPPWAADGSTNGAGIIDSRQYGYTILTPEDTVPGGTVGTTTNTDLPTVVEQEPAIDGQDSRLQGEGQIDYDNPNTVIHTERVTPILTDCTVSVSINATTAGAVDIDTNQRHVALAAGINPVVTEEMTADQYLDTKVSILVTPFFDPNPDNSEEPDSSGFQLPPQITLFGFEIPTWILLAAGAGVILFVIILLVIILTARRKKKKKIQQQLLAEQEQAAAVEELMAAVGISTAEPAGADVMSLQSEKSMALRQDIRQFAEENPEIAAQLVKVWLRGDDDNA